MTMGELIVKLEAASEGSRALDRETHEMAVRKPPFHAVHGRARYTQSVDDAFRLVPEGFMWLLGHTGLSDGWHAYRADVYQSPGGSQGLASTPALALTIAALRARLALTGDQEGER